MSSDTAGCDTPTRQIKHLSEIEDIDRFVEPEMESPLCDMLWADPINEDDSHKLTDAEYQTFLDTDFIANQVCHVRQACPWRCNACRAKSCSTCCARAI